MGSDLIFNYNIVIFKFFYLRNNISGIGRFLRKINIDMDW